MDTEDGSGARARGGEDDVDPGLLDMIAREFRELARKVDKWCAVWKTGACPFMPASGSACSKCATEGRQKYTVHDYENGRIPHIPQILDAILAGIEHVNRCIRRWVSEHAS